MNWLLLVIALAGCSKSEAKQEPAPKHEDRNDPAEARPPLRLAVTIDGTQATWQQDAFDRTPHFAAANKSGETRDAWSLRELAHTLVGPSARVVAVIGDKRQAIDPAAWADASKTPFVHRTRRGWLKFRWAEKDGTWDETDVKDVSGLEIVR